MEAVPLILIVDRNQRNVDLLCRLVEKNDYQACSATDLGSVDRILDERFDIALVLLDLAGFTRDVWERCERFRARQIPFLLVSPEQSAIIQQESLAYGARGVLVKPLVMRELLGLIRSLIGDRE